MQATAAAIRGCLRPGTRGAAGRRGGSRTVVCGGMYGMSGRQHQLDLFDSFLYNPSFLSASSLLFYASDVNYFIYFFFCFPYNLM